MPTSTLHLIPTIVALAQGTVPDAVLDIGPGRGKYGALLGEYTGATRIDALEAWPGYVTDYGLEGIYDTVDVGDAVDLDEVDLVDYDLVLLIDVLEHLDKGPAVELLHRIPGWVIISTPRWFTSQTTDVPTETHRSAWTLAEFGQLFGPRVDVLRTEYGQHIIRLSPQARP